MTVRRAADGDADAPHRCGTVSATRLCAQRRGRPREQEDARVGAPAASVGVSLVRRGGARSVSSYAPERRELGHEPQPVPQLLAVGPERCEVLAVLVYRT